MRQMLAPDDIMEGNVEGAALPTRRCRCYAQLPAMTLSVRV